MLLQLPIEIVEHDTRFDNTGFVTEIERDDLVQVLRDIDDKAVVDSLSALRGATAAWSDNPTFVTRDCHGAKRIVFGFRYDHAERRDLVKRGIGGVAAARKRIEQY